MKVGRSFKSKNDLLRSDFVLSILCSHVTLPAQGLEKACMKSALCGMTDRDFFDADVLDYVSGFVHED